MDWMNVEHSSPRGWPQMRSMPRFAVANHRYLCSTVDSAACDCISPDVAGDDDPYSSLLDSRRALLPSRADCIVVGATTHGVLTVVHRRQPTPSSVLMHLTLHLLHSLLAIFRGVQGTLAESRTMQSRRTSLALPLSDTVLLPVPAFYVKYSTL